MTARASTPVERARVLVVENDDSIRADLSAHLENNGYGCVVVSTAAEADGLLDGEESFAVLITDMDLPGGVDLVARVSNEDLDVATVVLTRADSAQVADAALETGAYGYIIKPFEDNAVLINVASAIRRRRVEMENRTHSKRLEQMVRDRSGEVWNYVTKLELAERDMRVLQEEFIHRLSLAAEFRDDESRRHIERMSHYAAMIADRLGESPERCERIRIASAMHDVGKIGVPDGILTKPGKLTPPEWDIMKRHCQIGHRILSGSSTDLLNMAATIALSHHERIDGNGYPYGLKGDDIPVVARIAAIADVFDALTSDKVYKEAVSLSEAFTILEEGRGTQFDADLIDLFLSEKSRILGIKDRFADVEVSENEMDALSALAADA